jgi:hypothetical protein
MNTETALEATISDSRRFIVFVQVDVCIIVDKNLKIKEFGHRWQEKIGCHGKAIQYLSTND